MTKFARTKHSLYFNHRIKDLNIIPPSLNVKALVKTPYGRQVARRASIQFVKARIQASHRMHKETSLIHFRTRENHKPIQLHIYIHGPSSPDRSLIRDKRHRRTFITNRGSNRYCKLEVKILRFTQHFHNNANLPLSNNAVNKNYANLPKLELPFFDGKLENWISFSNKIILFWLGIYWKKRYDNKRDLIFNLIQRIIDLPKLTIESSTQLLFLVDNSYEIIRSLETLGYKLDELSDIIIGKILSDKLDKTTKRSWNMTVDNNHIPSCSELLKFIETHAKALNTSETERGLPLIKRSMKLQVHNLTKANCFLCQQEHGIYLCPTFLDTESLERRRKVKQLKLCFNCLRNNHSVNQCRSEFKCRKCQGKHNTLIHIDANINQFKEHTVGIPAIEEPDKNQAESSVKENNDALGVTSIHKKKHHLFDV
ncbi:hypothetical protein LAZ67_9002228 [Cordylochernes scorpioides]|uniref:Uncharacterized protein n=1 Tax=Cordylochernes scorpioides TaxID=51811 RepID=A0ABY6KUB4_9ARAC|nr:hypothetical protein LAZ67_9002228 [Cordylochernes scorpioides]